VFRTRLLTAIVAIPLVLALNTLGGLWFFGLIAAVLTVAVIEFCRLVERGHFRPAPAFSLALLWVLLLDAQYPRPGPGWTLLGPGVSLVLMGSLAWQLAHRGRNPMADWALSVAGPLYVGWLGSYLIRLRGLEEGMWWVLTVIPANWLADTGAYFVGRTWGRRKLAPTLSPKKTWEGYVGGIVVAMAGTAGLAALWGRWAGPNGPSPIEGLALGALIGTLATLGDLAVSMLKRQVGVKDTGTVFPGHGGALDRVDSLLWAAVIGYYFALWLHGA